MAFNPDQPRDEHGRWAATFSSDRKTAEREVNELHGKVLPAPLTEEEKKAVDSYVYGNYEAMNRGLRKEGRTSDKVSALDAVIAKTALPHDVVVYRGTGDTLGRKIYDQWKSGKRNIEFVDKGFVSTSAHKSVADSFSLFNRIEIRIPKGSKALPVYNGGEAEVILPRGSKFKVISATKTAASKRRITVELVQ